MSLIIENLAKQIFDFMEANVDYDGITLYNVRLLVDIKHLKKGTDVQYASIDEHGNIHITVGRGDDDDYDSDSDENIVTAHLKLSVV